MFVSGDGTGGYLGVDGGWMHLPRARNDIVSPRHLFKSSPILNYIISLTATLKRVSPNDEMIDQQFQISEPIIIDAEFSGFIELEFDNNIDVEVFQIWTSKYLHKRMKKTPCQDSKSIIQNYDFSFI